MKPYYEHQGITIYNGDCEQVFSELSPGYFDAIITDPPYGETALQWDSRKLNWLDLTSPALKPICSAWVFGSFRYFFESAEVFKGWNLAQDLIWEKQNGSSFHADRFKRVHECIVHFYRGSWSSIVKNPQMTLDAVARVTRRKSRPPHMGGIMGMKYVSEDGGPRLMRSVIRERNCHGFALHPTQKPLELLLSIVAYSTNAGDCILDPFMGSGTSCLAAKQLGRKAIGIELEEKYCEIAAKRLSQELLPFS